MLVKRPKAFVTALLASAVLTGGVASAQTGENTRTTTTETMETRESNDFPWGLLGLLGLAGLTGLKRRDRDVRAETHSGHAMPVR